VLTGSTILVADDEPDIRELFQDLLEPSGAQVRLANSGAEALEVLEANSIDLAILDVRMPDPDGLTLLKQLREQGNDLPVIIVTAQESSTITIEAMQHGAYDYIAKPFDPDSMLTMVERALEYRRRTQQAHTVDTKRQSKDKDPRDVLIGRSAPMQEVYKLIGRVANSDVTVLITGESGTGKERVAQAIHQTSNRRDKPFVTVNCAALPETLLESELFGHEKGAFTGAMSQRKGRFEQAAKGTIFLDEVGEMSPATQKKLLRVLQERSFERVGGNVTIKSTARVIAATNRDLQQDVVEGHFREDLYYRLNVINIHMPPLRERKDDIPLLVEYFLSRQPKRSDGSPPRLTDETLEWLHTYEWPGNVRQLENAIERAIVLAQGQLIEPEQLLMPGDEIQHEDQDYLLLSALAGLLKRGEGLDTMLHRVRTQLVSLALQQKEGDRTAAAQMLGISEQELD
jgi:DNA-binding NtrC family response regulator